MAVVVKVLVTLPIRIDKSGVMASPVLMSRTPNART